MKKYSRITFSYLSAGLLISMNPAAAKTYTCIIEKAPIALVNLVGFNKSIKKGLSCNLVSVTNGTSTFTCNFTFAYYPPTEQTPQREIRIDLNSAGNTLIIEEENASHDQTDWYSVINTPLANGIDKGTDIQGLSIEFPNKGIFRLYFDGINKEWRYQYHLSSTPIINGICNGSVI